MIHLRPLVLRLIEDGVVPKEEGQHTTFQTEEHGDIVAEMPEEGILTFRFTKYDRLFVRGKDGVLVEKVWVNPPMPEPESIRTPTTLEQWVVKWANHRTYPEDLGDTQMNEYGMDGAICIVTRVERGIIADFFVEDVKLFFDFAYRVVRRYLEPSTKFKRKSKEEIQRAISKAKAEIRGENVQPVEQLDYEGQVEILDQRFYSNRVQCPCGNVRWVKDQDVFQVKMCKPCVTKKKKSRKR